MSHRSSLVWLALSADDKNDVCCGLRFQGFIGWRRSKINCHYFGVMEHTYIHTCKVSLPAVLKGKGLSC